MELKTNPEYEALLPKLSNEEFVALRESIRNEGQHYPIAINAEGVILDGHHRYRICQQLCITPKTAIIMNFSNKLLEKKFVIESNLMRRHLNKFQRAKLILPLLEIEKALAKERQLTPLKNVGEQVSSAKYFADAQKPKRTRKLLTTEQREAHKLKAKAKREEKKKTGIFNKPIKRATLVVAKKAQISDRTLEKAKTILEKGSEELKQKVENGQTSINHAYKMVKRNEQIAEMAKHHVEWKALENITLLEGAFQEQTKTIPDNSIDVIITDPPYGKQYLDLYEKLGEVSKRLLKPNGSLLVMTGQSYLPDIFNLLRQNLTYNWIVAYLTPGGQSAQLWERKVNTFWKPVVWFVKGKYEGNWAGDVVKSAPNDNEKQLMKWQQSESGIADLVERFTAKNDLILDPLMGSGTTGVVALRLGRRFIGIDIDPKMVEIAKQRISVLNDCET